MEQKALPAVSIIVPVYNAEETLARCIDSVLRQNFEGFELLLINDGSSDGSGKICDTYAEKDPRVRVVHKENTGVSDSRNLAIRQARGTWLQFIDADDWIAPEATGLLLSTAETHSCDLVISDFYRVIDDRVAHKGAIHEDGLLTREEFASHMIENPADYYYGVLWNKLYRKAIVERYSIRMDEEVSWCEDFMFNLDYIGHAESIYVLRLPLYYYVKTKHSLSSQGASITKTIQMKTDVFEYYNKFYKEVFGKKEYEKIRLRVYRFLLDAAGDGVVPPVPLPGSLRLGEERVKVSPHIIKNENILSDSYLAQKSLEACLRPVALRYDLQLEELYLLLCLEYGYGQRTRKELAEVLRCSTRKLSATMQSLKAKGLISWAEQTSAVTQAERSFTRQLDIRLLPPAKPILDALHGAEKDYDKLRFSGLTQEEMEAYENLSQRIRGNMLKALG